MMNAKAYDAKAVEMEEKADACFSAEAAEMYRDIAAHWRQLRIETIAQDAREAKT
jgi:hypothetical protein